MLLIINTTKLKNLTFYFFLQYPFYLKEEKMIKEFSQEIIEQLGYYVYGLIDPRNGRYFCIGKGNRVFEQY